MSLLLVVVRIKLDNASERNSKSIKRDSNMHWIFTIFYSCFDNTGEHPDKISFGNWCILNATAPWR